MSSSPMNLTFRVLFPKNLIKQTLYISLIFIINAAENYAFVRQKLFCKNKARVQHGKKIVAGNGICIICFCKFAHAVFSVGRVNVNYVDLTFVLNQKILQCLIVVANNQFIYRFCVVGAERKFLIFLKIFNAIRHFFKPLVKMQACAFISCSQSCNVYSFFAAFCIVYKFFKKFSICRFKNFVLYAFIYFFD